MKKASAKIPRFKTMAELNAYTKRHPPLWPGDYDRLSNWIKETKAYERAQTRALEKTPRRKKSVTLAYPDKRRVTIPLPTIHRSVEETRQSRINLNWRMDPNKKATLLKSACPCIECNGDGWIYDPNDPPCPAEGNKMRSKITCPKCKGSRLASDEELKAFHLELQNAQREKYDKTLEGLTFLQKALNKLTAAEYQAIRQDNHR